MNLPDSRCKHGYTKREIEAIIPDHLKQEWDHYIRGQTGLVCQGGECAIAHGNVTYEHDLKQFLRKHDVEV